MVVAAANTDIPTNPTRLSNAPSTARIRAASLETTKRDWLEVNAILVHLWGPGYSLTHPSLA